MAPFCGKRRTSDDFVPLGGTPLKTAVKMSVAVATFFVVAFAMQADEDHIRWVKKGAPTETYVTGGRGLWNNPERPTV